MRITLPLLAKCADRREYVERWPFAQHIAAVLPTGYHLHAFHFFVDWTDPDHPVLGRDLWLTRLLHLDDGETLATLANDGVLAAFNGSGAGQDLEALTSFAGTYEHQAMGVILPELGSVDASTPLWRAQYAEGQLTVNPTDVASLMRDIRIRSGGEIAVGRKGLKLGTSRVECYLSRGTAAYPGDVDAVITGIDNRVCGVIEYKAHTITAPLCQHLVVHYYPWPDARKYRRLAALVEHYSAGRARIPLTMLYHSENLQQMRLQNIHIEAHRAVVENDSGDVVTRGLTDSAMAEQIVNWMLGPDGQARP